jgi:hypothetical protein
MKRKFSIRCCIVSLVGEGAERKGSLKSTLLYGDEMDIQIYNQ